MITVFLRPEYRAALDVGCSPGKPVLLLSLMVVHPTSVNTPVSVRVRSTFYYQRLAVCDACNYEPVRLMPPPPPPLVTAALAAPPPDFPVS